MKKSNRRMNDNVNSRERRYEMRIRIAFKSDIVYSGDMIISESGERDMRCEH